MVARLYAVGESLAAFPKMGREVPEVETEHIREVIRDGYRIVYVISEKQVDILAVLHGWQDLGKKLRRE